MNTTYLDTTKKEAFAEIKRADFAVHLDNAQLHSLNAFTDALTDKVALQTNEMAKAIVENVIDGAREDGESDLRGIKATIIAALTNPSE